LKIALTITLATIVQFSSLAQQPARAPLPDDVEKRTITIWSDGTRMTGDLYLPKNRKPDEKLPGMIFCAGTGGTRKGTPERLGPRFAEAGFAFLAFDYRGWGDSDSKLMLVGKMPQPDEKNEVTVRARAIRWQMDFADQTADIRSAIGFLAGEPGVASDRIGILGSSYGGGLATWTAGNDPRVKCVAAQVPGMGGGRGEAAVRYAYELLTKQARGETEPVPFETGKLGGKLAVYQNMRANPAKGIGFSAIEAAAKIRVPMLIIDAENEELMDKTQNGQRVSEIVKANGGPVEYHVLKGIGHYGVYREAFSEATALEIAWFNKHLKTPAQLSDAK
jgi:hypothetical protein